MKKVLINLILIMLLPLINLGQELSDEDCEKVFSAKEIVWYGIDFSKAKFIASKSFSSGFTNPAEIQENFIPSWNEWFLNEGVVKKRKKALKVEQMPSNIEIVNERNQNLEGMVVYENYEIDKSTVQEIISEYNTERNDGIGLVFIVESLNKEKNKSFVYVTFFDIKSKKVLMSEKYIGDPGGFGVKQFWNVSLYEVQKQIKMSRFKKIYSE